MEDELEAGVAKAAAAVEEEEVKGRTQQFPVLGGSVARI